MRNYYSRLVGLIFIYGFYYSVLAVDHEYGHAECGHDASISARGVAW